MNTKKLNSVKGFTLIEVLIVVAIIGIVAAIAYPSYTNYLVRAARAEGSALLLEVMEKQEQHYRRNRTYTTDLSELGYAVDQETDSGSYKLVAPASCGGNVRIRCINLTVEALKNRPATENLQLSSRGEKLGPWN